MSYLLVSVPGSEASASEGPPTIRSLIRRRIAVKVLVRASVLDLPVILDLAIINLSACVC